MTKLLTFIIIIFVFACKEKPNQTLLVNNQTIQEKGTQNNKIYKSCEEAIIDIVKSSNALGLKSFKNAQIRINNLTSEKISIELYVSNDISENSAEKKVSENSVGWLEFFPLTKKLQDITNDPENPELLKYDITILEKNDISKMCGLVEIFPTKSLNSFPSYLEGEWAVNCGNGLTTFSINKGEGLISLYGNSISIKVQVEKRSNDEYILKFKQIVDQKDWVDNSLQITESEISKDKIIGNFFIKKDDKVELHWVGLYNMKKQKIDFADKNFSLIRENDGKNPILLEKC